MMLLIPEIVIKDGKCHHKISGLDEHLSGKFMDDPVQMAKLLRRENAKCLHITDLDSIDGGPGNQEIILSLVSNVEIPIQVLGFWKDSQVWASMLENGIYRVIIPSIQVFETNVIEILSARFPISRIAAFIEINEEYDKKKFSSYVRDLHINKIERIVIGEFGDDFIKSGINIRPYLAHLIDTAFKVTAYNMIKGISDIHWFESRSVVAFDSFVVGRPLYENAFPCQTIWREIESKLE
jgi:phosphoribosylformimino-5-aminoimidazole carboxamide ribotide isomerase